MNPNSINLEILNPSRKRPKPGDIFVLRPKNHDYIFGRVIKMVPNLLCGFNGPLIYIYKTTTKHLDNIPILSPIDLLIRPIATNYQPWSKGYFMFIINHVLKKDDILPRHCFYSKLRNSYYDEDGHILPNRIEPCGIFGADSFRTIDDSVSEALGIPLAKE